MRHGHHNGFEKLRSKIAERGAVRNPGAVAAPIGRKKYGKSKLKLRGVNST